MKENARKRIIEKTKGRCWYCWVVLRPSFETIDHVHPLARGGKDEEENAVAACKNCNGEKGCLNLEEYRLYVAIIKAGGPSFTWQSLEWMVRRGWPHDLEHHQFAYEANAVVDGVI